MLRDLISALIVLTIMVGTISLAAYSVDHTRTRYETITNR